ncbi:MAG TPA: ubiquinol-cytochrome c reductase iron-sulfur subunit [Acidobacteriota bacterium]|nr:ubiquinol-cytochrome c reductase iron-sulfur subunit [Acidobacteriota bacterium]
MSDYTTVPDAEDSGAVGGGGLINRRDFLDELTAAALGIAGLGAVAVTLRYLSPNVLFEPPTSFRVGTPEEYPVNSVAYIAEQQVYIVRSPEGFYAVSAICTHLGCVTQWKQDLDLIACPCHGSKFQRDGSVVTGPAPRSLPHYAIHLMPDGNLLVDKLDIVPPSQILRV